MTNLWAFLFVLGVLIFVHELGHFLMARRLGVRVLTFSLGFGPKLLKFTRGDTEYAISAIPLGGYVKMAGENPDEARSGRPDEFLSKTKWERFLVYIMGPAMNLLLAFVVTAAVLYQGAESPTYEQEPPIVGAVIKDSPAARAGLQIGDRIVTVAGREMRTWDQFFIEIGSRADRETEIVVDRGGRRETITVTPEPKTKYEVGEIGVLPKTRLQLAEVTPRMAADRAGLRRGDVIAALDGKSDPEQQALIAHIKSNPNKPLRFSIVRDGQPMDVTVTPEGDPGSALIGIRISPYEFRIIQPGFLEALRLSLVKNWEWTRLIFRTLAGLFTRETSVRQLMGPVGIAELSGGAAQLGWTHLFNLMAMISLNLGLLNLMPIPVLDGGHVFIMLLEGIARRDFSVRMKEKMLLAGFVVLMMLMVTVIYNDLMRVQWIERMIPWR
ncbi:MAG TPA: RIP metalloprotease RseP [Vicinamibacterales bacterium]|nr:RIP metalloprotease RseP [Vicinamibacterales bacterium]